MKRVFQTLTVLGALIAGPAFAQSTDWVNDWFDNYTTTSAGSYQSQQRGYYTLGSFQGRWRMSNDYLVSASPPRMKVGCGGIDLFGGAFSYLDPEFLVEKFERIVQAAPAFAFNIAFQNLCKECAAIMESLENLTDQLNSMQINDCRLSQRLAAVVMPSNAKEQKQDIDNLKQEVASVTSIGDSLRKNWQAFQDAVRGADGATPDDIKPKIEGCMADLRDLFTDGSVIESMADKMGLAEYAPLMRGLVGDVIIEPTATDFSSRPLLPCPGTDKLDAADFLEGTVDQQDTAGNCTPAGESRVVDMIDTRLTGIATRMQSATALTPADIAFVQNSPLPIYALLRDSVVAGTVNETVAMVREPVAVAYAHKILDDLFRLTANMLAKVEEIKATQAQDPASPDECNPDVVKGEMQRITELGAHAESYRRALHENYTKKTTEMLAQLQASREFLETRRQVLNKQAVTIKQ